MASQVAGKLRAAVSNVVIEYDAAGGGRHRRTFPTQAQARRFYAEMRKVGRKPRVVAADTR